MDRTVERAESESGNGNGKIRWKEIDRIVGVAAIIVTMVYYFSGFERRLDAIDLKLSIASSELRGHAESDKERRRNTAYTHSILIPPLDCRRCMGGLKQ